MNAHKPFRSDYLSCLLDPETRTQVFRDFVKLIQDSKVEFDVVAFRGMSGALIAPSVAECLDKGLVIIRKDDGCHSPYTMEGAVGFNRYIIVDDFICTGKTINAIARKVKVECPQARCAGIFLYHELGAPTAWRLGVEQYEQNDPGFVGESAPVYSMKVIKDKYAITTEYPGCQDKLF